MNGNYLFLTLGDDFIGTRASENEKKMINTRKSDKGRHSANTVGDALSKIILRLRFARRENFKLDAISSLLSALFEGRGEKSRSGCIVTADRGYEKAALLKLMERLGVEPVFLVSNYFQNVHLFVAILDLNARKNDEQMDTSTNIENSLSNLEASRKRSLQDQGEVIIINYHPNMGSSVITASSLLGPLELGNHEITGITVKNLDLQSFAKYLGL